MDEWDVLSLLSDKLGISDDCGVVPWGDTNALITTDMLHRKTDFPEGIKPETIGWRAMAVSLSDIAGMGGHPLAMVLAFGSPEFEKEFIERVTDGALKVCDDTGAKYIGGDMDKHDELTLVSTGLGRADSPVMRSGSCVGDSVCITGELGRTALALRYFDEGKHKRANDLFEFDPRVSEGIALSEYATSMMDISDGLAVSLHQLSEASGNGFEVESSELPVIEGVEDLDEAVFTGEDYELLFTIPEDEIDEASRSVDFTVIGECVGSGIKMAGEELEKRGYQH